MKRFYQFLMVIILALFSLSLFASENYLIFVDAGSSGSRLHIYRYQLHPSSLPDITEVFSENTKPGISSYADRPNDAGKSLKKLFDDATTYLHHHHTLNLHSVPVTLYATAGMRLLPKNKQTLIYENIHHYLKTHYVFSIKQIQTITGKMEGIYGWLDINYLLKNFQHDTPTIGSIDMGGASTQIAFETEKAEEAIPSEDKIKMIINHQSYRIFSKSFLGLGQDQARYHMMNLPYADACFPSFYKINNSLVGHFNFMQCATNYQTVINNHHVKEQLIPLENQHFIAFSGVYHDYEFLEVINTPDQATVENRIQTICYRTWPQLQKDYPAIPEEYLSTYCANTVYVDQLFNQVYQIKADHLVVAKQINHQDIDWTLGAALYSLLE